MSYGDWSLLSLWTLGWGINADRTFVSPDAIFSLLTLMWCLAVIASARRAAKKAYRGDPEAARRSILPVFVPLLWDLVVALGILEATALAVIFIVDFSTSYTIFLLAPINAVRFFVFELISEGIALFFFQPTITRQALKRALIPAAVWATAYSAINTALLVRYFTSPDPSIPRYFMGGINYAIAATYVLFVLVLNWGRPALRPYAWFVCIWRVMCGSGLMLSTVDLPDFPIWLFDLAFLLVQVAGFPLAVYAAARADTSYWRGLCRSLPHAEYNTCTALLGNLCGVGDIGIGLGLRGWGEEQRAAVKRSQSTHPIEILAGILRCDCFRTARDDPKEKSAAGQLLLGHAESGGHPGYGTADQHVRPAAETGADTDSSESLLQHERRTQHWHGVSVAIGRELSWSCIIDSLLYPFTYCVARLGRARRFSLDNEAEADSPVVGPHARLLNRSLRAWVTHEAIVPDDPMTHLMQLLESSRGKLLDFAYLRMDQVVYHGSVAVVFRGRYNKETVAVKVFKPFQITRTDLDGFAAEASLCSLLQHPHIVRYYGICCCPPDISLVFEWCSRGHLRDVLNSMILSGQSRMPHFSSRLPSKSLHYLKNKHVTGYPYFPVCYVPERQTAQHLLDASSQEFNTVSDIDMLQAAESSGKLSIVYVALTEGEGCEPSDRNGSLSRDASLSSSSEGAPAAVADPKSHRTTSAAVLSGASDMPQLHAQLKVDIVLLGGTPVDIADCPYDDPDEWPVWDVANMLDCWQFDPFERYGEEEGGLRHLPSSGAIPTADCVGDGTTSAPAYSRPRYDQDVDGMAPDSSISHVLDWPNRLRLGLEIAQAVAYMHSLYPQVVHRDIKSHNILLTDAWSSKLCDFGEAKSLRAQLPMTGNRGTLNWMAPEVMTAGTEASESDAPAYGPAADVYSLSMVLWELLTGGVPFEPLGRNDILEVVAVYHARPPLPAAAPRSLAHLIRCGWHPLPDRRPSAALFVRILQRLYQEAQKHVVFNDVDLGAEPMPRQVSALSVRRQNGVAAPVANDQSIRRLPVTRSGVRHQPAIRTNRSAAPLEGASPTSNPSFMWKALKNMDIYNMPPGFDAYSAVPGDVGGTLDVMDIVGRIAAQSDEALPSADTDQFVAPSWRRNQSARTALQFDPLGSVELKDAANERSPLRASIGRQVSIRSPPHPIADAASSAVYTTDLLQDEIDESTIVDIPL